MKRLVKTVFNKISKKDTKDKSEKSSPALTEMLSRSDLSNLFYKMIPSELQKMTVILIKIDNFENTVRKHGDIIANDVLNDFIVEINNIGGKGAIIAKWSNQQFILAFPESTLEQSANKAIEIRKQVQQKTWKNSIKLTCSTGVSEVDEDDLHILISQIQTPLNKGGTNKAFVAKAKPVKIAPPSSLPVQKVDIKATTCSATGVLNQAGFQLFSKKLYPAELAAMSVVFIEVAKSEEIENAHGKSVFDSVSQQFVNQINQTYSDGIISRWSSKDYLLLCPNTTLEEATNLADKISKVMKNTIWPHAISIACNTEVNNYNWNDLTTQSTEENYSEDVMMNASVA